jgi:hypothetical protein
VAVYQLKYRDPQTDQNRIGIVSGVLKACHPGGC